MRPEVVLQHFPRSNLVAHGEIHLQEVPVMTVQDFYFAKETVVLYFSFGGFVAHLICVITKKSLIFIRIPY